MWLLIVLSYLQGYSQYEVLVVFFFEGIYFSKEYFLKICETKHSWILSVSTTTDPHSINKCFFFLYQLIHKLLIFFEESITEASFYKTLTISLWVLLMGSWISSSFSGRGSLLCPFTLTLFFSIIIKTHFVGTKLQLRQMKLFPHIFFNTPTIEISLTLSNCVK